jgi:hypothetical protein
MRTAATLLLAACLLAGCGGVYTKSPASDEATTRYDDRLAGFWRDEGSGASPLSDDGARTIFVIGKDEKSGLQRLRTITLQAADIIKENDCLVRATSIRDRDYASVHGPEGNSWWTVFRYEVLDRDTIRVLGMDENKVDADVKSGDVSGRSDHWTTKGDGKSHVAVTLDGSTAALRQYIERRGDGIYAADRPLVLRRLRIR